MALDSKIIKDFAAAAGGSAAERSTQTRATAKVVGGKVYAQLPGATALTPVESTVTVSDGDELLVGVDDHRAVVVGNITSKALDTATFYTLLEDGSLDIKVNDLTVGAGGSVSIESGADLTVGAGGSVNINDKVILGEDGSLTLAVDSFSLGGGESIGDIDDLKGEKGDPGKDGADGTDGVDVTSQYVYYSSGYGLAVTPSPNSTSGRHALITTSGFYVKDGSSTLASFTADEVKLGDKFTITGGSVVASGALIASAGVWVTGTSHMQGIASTDAITVSSGGITVSSGGIQTTNSGDIAAAGRLKSTGAATGSGTAAVWYNSYLRVSSSSSRRYKHDIADVSADELAPERLYDLPVRQFVFNDGYLVAGDEYEGRTVVGLIAEEVAEHYPVAAYRNEGGEVENWDARYIVPPMLKLIQDQKNQIDELAARVAALEGGVQ